MCKMPYILIIQYEAIHCYFQTIQYVILYLMYESIIMKAINAPSGVIYYVI